MQYERLPSIGGYFELERPAKRTTLPAQALRYQSARAALRALLETGRPSQLWLPGYICDVVVQAAREAATPVRFYALSPDLGVPHDVVPGPGEWLLYVNYFGLCGAHSRVLLDRVDPNQVILDHAQAYFVPPADCLATVYSPRKFFGLPDGGLLYTRLPMAPPAEQDQQSVERVNHLIKRAAFDAESGYADFQTAEMQLGDSLPRRMSQLTHRLLEDADSARVRDVRAQNFAHLHQMLGASNAFPLCGEPAPGALCYPYLTREPGVRERLSKARIFVARYWPDSAARVVSGSVEDALIQHCLPLPIDQRYGVDTMQRIAALVHASTL